MTNAMKATLSIEDVVQRLQGLKPTLKRRFKVREIGVFGSLARGEQTTSSDIDLLVEFEEGADLFDWIGLMLFLEETLGHPVDVVPKRALREELREQVMSQVIGI